MVDLESSLKAKYVNKVFTLRSFYADDHLRFDSSGNPRSEVHPQSWTTSIIEIDKVKVLADKVELNGTRWAEVYDPKQSKFVAVRTKQSVQIVVDRDAAQPDATVLTAIGRVFISENERLVDLVPDYWKPIVSGAWETVPQEDGPDCHRMKGQISRTASGDIWMSCEEHAKTKTPLPQATSIDVSALPYHIEKGMNPPKVISAPDPVYTEIASLAKFQGTSVLELTVTSDGTPSDISISRPIGFGLDDQAVATVKNWKFHPATLHHTPVPVRINVEVNFRMY